jgi:hypothetical protein
VQLVYEVQDVAGGAAQPVEAVDDQFVARTQECQHRLQFGAAIARRAGTGFDAHDFAAHLFQLRLLDPKVPPEVLTRAYPIRYMSALSHLGGLRSDSVTNATAQRISDISRRHIGLSPAGAPKWDIGITISATG